MLVLRGALAQGVPTNCGCTETNYAAVVLTPLPARLKPPTPWGFRWRAARQDIFFDNTLSQPEDMRARPAISADGFTGPSSCVNALAGRSGRRAGRVGRRKPQSILTPPSVLSALICPAGKADVCGGNFWDGARRTTRRRRACRFWIKMNGQYTRRALSTACGRLSPLVAQKLAANLMRVFPKRFWQQRIRNFHGPGNLRLPDTALAMYEARRKSTLQFQV